MEDREIFDLKYGPEDLPPQANLGSIPDYEEGPLRMYVQTAPTALSLAALWERGREIRPTNKAYERYDLWMISYGIGTVAERSSSQFTQIGFKVTYSSPRELSILDVLPQTQFATLVGANINVRAGLTLTGTFAPLGEHATLETGSEKVGAGVALSVSAEAELVATVSLTIKKTVVNAVGFGGSTGEWVLNKAGQPLLGDFPFIHVVRVPKGSKSIRAELDAHVFVAGRTGWFPRRAVADTKSIVISLTEKK